MSERSTHRRRNEQTNWLMGFVGRISRAFAVTTSIAAAVGVIVLVVVLAL